MEGRDGRSMERKNHQRLYLTLIALFFILVIFLTFFSKTFYNAHLRTVTIALPMTGQLYHSEESDSDQYQEAEIYDGIIPSSALYKDQKGYYVWSIQEEESVLGNYYAVKRVSVDFIDADDTHSAVIGLTENMVVIISDSEGLTEGEHVRYQEL